MNKSLAPNHFDKYQKCGAYHWQQLDCAWSNRQFNSPLAARYSSIIKLLPKSVEKLLDVGCGDGYLLYQVNRGHPDAILYGVDTEIDAIHLAEEQLKKKSIKASLAQLSSEQLPFASDLFDAVVMTDVIEHLEAPQNTLTEIFRVLKKQGLLLLSTPNKQPDMIWDKHHVQEFTALELDTMLAAHFQAVQITACWPMQWFRQYQKSDLRRKAINHLTRLGYNPFCKTAKPSLKFGQLIAKCVK